MSQLLARRDIFLAEMGVAPIWHLRAANSALAVEDATVLPTWTQPSATEIASMDWDALQTVVAECAQYGRHESRTRAVFGSGDRYARWLFVGDAPSEQDAVQGTVFSGSAGILLDNMLSAIGLRRDENTYLTNVVKWHVTPKAAAENASLIAAENATDLAFLARQIALIQPSIIVALGKRATLALLRTSTELDAEAALSTGAGAEFDAGGADSLLDSLRGHVHRYAEIPLIVTHHPADLLRQPEAKSQAWRDLCLAMASFTSTTAVAAG